MQWWTKLKARYQDVVEEYGKVALGTFVTIAATNFLTFWALINAGVELPGVVAGTGKFVAAFAAYKVFMPFRIGLAIVLTPFVARFLRRFRKPDLAALEAARQTEADTMDLNEAS